MKKYDLKDLISPGSRARREVRSDLLVGNTSNGYDEGDILDANATKELISEKVQEATGNVSGNVAEELNSLKEKDDEHDQKIAEIESRMGNISARIDENNDGNLILGF